MFSALDVQDFLESNLFLGLKIFQSVYITHANTIVPLKIHQLILMWITYKQYENLKNININILFEFIFINIL